MAQAGLMNTLFTRRRSTVAKIHFHHFYTLFLLFTSLYLPLKAMNENSQEISTRKIIKDFFVKIFMMENSSIALNVNYFYFIILRAN